MSLSDSIRRILRRSRMRRVQNLRKLAGMDDRSYLESKQACPVCNKHIDSQELKRNLYVCPCDIRHHFRISGYERIRFIADNGEIREFGADMESLNPLEFPDYEDKLIKSKQKTGMNEGVITGNCRISGHEVVVAVMSFAFMGGSMGSVVGEKIARAMRLGADRKVPVVIFVTSGGARMQEGMLSLMQMAKTSHAASLLDEAGVPLFVVLTDPTTGGVTASFAMLGDVTLAEPNALIGFAGQRVVAGTIREKVPENFRSSEYQLSRGFVDMVVDRKDLKDTLAFLLETHNPGGGRRRRGRVR